MDTEPGKDEPALDVSTWTADTLRAYVAANAGTFTDETITAELTRAGYSAEDVRAALVEAARGEVPAPTRRAVVTILVAYGVTFALLSLGMLANASAGDRCCTPTASGGILILAGSLGVALILSLIWMGSRRAAALILALLVGAYGLSSLSGGLVGVAAIGIAAVLVVLAFRSTPKPSTRKTATLGALIALPVVLLVIIAGLCIATGLPIPRNG